MSLLDEVVERFWTFGRGDTAAREFETWAYAASELETLLPRDLFEAIISADYGNKSEVFTLRRHLAAFARTHSDMRCACRTLRDLADVAMGQHEDVFSTLEERVRRAHPIWWLSACRCRECGQWWLVASEERINDVFLLKRLTDEAGQAIETRGTWPDTFDRFSTLLEIGRERGHQFRFVDPLSPSLVQTVADLAKEKPGITASEVAKLLQVDLDHAQQLAKRARVKLSRL